MSYIQRKTESNIKQLSVEGLQGGFIFRFNEYIVEKENMNNESITSYNYDEYFFNELPLIYDVEEIIGNKLSNEQSLFIVNNSIINIDIIKPQILNLEDLKIQKISEFDPILNDFTILISRAKLITGESDELNRIIGIIKNMKDSTILAINNSISISDLSDFYYKEDDINRLKELLKPYIF